MYRGPCWKEPGTPIVKNRPFSSLKASVSPSSLTNTIWVGPWAPGQRAASVARETVFNQGSQTGRPLVPVQPTDMLCLACRIIPKSGQSK